MNASMNNKLTINKKKKFDIFGLMPIFKYVTGYPCLTIKNLSNEN